MGVDAAGDVVGHQQVGLQAAAVPPELQDDVDPSIQVVQDLPHGILHRSLLQEAEAAEHPQFALDGPQGPPVEGAPLQRAIQVLQRVILVQQPGDPALPQPPPQEVERPHLHVREGHQAGQTVHVLRIDLVIANAHYRVHLAAPPPGRLFVQREDGDAAGKELLQPLDLLPRLGLALPAVLVVHIEHQVDSHVLLDQPGQQRACEESLAGAGLAEYPCRALDKAAQVERHVDALHLQRVADVEVAGLLLLAEDERDLLLAGGIDRREVGGDGLDWLRLALPLFPPHRCGGRGRLQNQHRRDVDAPEDDRPLVNTGQERVGGIRRSLFDERIDGVQLHVGDDGEEAPPGLPAHDDVPAHSQPLDDRVLVEFNVQPLGEAPADDDAQPLDGLRLGWAGAEEGFQFLFG